MNRLLASLAVNRENPLRGPSFAGCELIVR